MFCKLRSHELAKSCFFSVRVALLNVIPSLKNILENILLNIVKNSNVGVLLLMLVCCQLMVHSIQ